MQYHHVIPAKAGIHSLVKGGRHTARCVSSHTALGIHPLVKGCRHTALCVSSHTALGIHPLVKGGRHTSFCVSSHTALGIHPFVKGGRYIGSCVSSHTALGIPPLVKGDRYAGSCVSSHTALGVHPLVKGGRHTEGVRGDFLLSLVFRFHQVTFIASPKKVTKESRPCGAVPDAHAPELPCDARSLRFARCGERPVIVCSAQSTKSDRLE